MLETLRIGNACSEVWAKERSIALGMHGGAALGVVCRGAQYFDMETEQVREIGYLSALGDNARGCECWRHCALVTRAATCGRKRGTSH